MRRWSLRVWQGLISGVLALFIVGGVALTTYIIVSDGMQLVARETSDRVASAAATVIREAARESEVAARNRGLTGAAGADLALADLRRRLPSVLSGVDLTGTHLALYLDANTLYWTTGQEALHSESVRERQRVIDTRRTVRTVEGDGEHGAGLISNADLGLIISRVPILLPAARTGVLEVAYEPRIEERVIDAIRVPMTILALGSMLVMVLLMQTSMAWVLGLINGLRQAADSIEAGQLDARLPEYGNNEIGDLAHSINTLVERLQRRAEAQSRFVADASHELATPVAGIRGYTSILRAWGGDDPKVRTESIDAIDRESARMARLTGELLNLLHADQGLRLKHEKFDLNAVVRDRLAATANAFLEKDIEFIGPEDDSMHMVGDSERMEDVISILLTNAAKYTPYRGTVQVATRRTRNEVSIAVSDTGRGIPPEDVPHVFDRFFRSEKTRVEGESGFGLGLAIARSIVENMGGTVFVQSEVGVGTTFTVMVPRGRL